MNSSPSCAIELLFPVSLNVRTSTSLLSAVTNAAIGCPAAEKLAIAPLATVTGCGLSGFPLTPLRLSWKTLSGRACENLERAAPNPAGQLIDVEVDLEPMAFR